MHGLHRKRCSTRLVLSACLGREPGRSGARIDRYLSERFGTVSIYVTGDPALALRSGTYALGYMAKPISRAQLEAAISYMAGIRNGFMPRDIPAGMVRLEPTGAMTSA